MLSEKNSIIGSDWPNKLSYAKRKKKNRSEKASVRSGIDRRTFRLRVPDSYRCATISTVTLVTSSLNRHTRRFNPRAWPFTWFNSCTRQEAYLFSWKIKLPKRFPDLLQFRFSLWQHIVFALNPARALPAWEKKSRKQKQVLWPVEWIRRTKIGWQLNEQCRRIRNGVS